MRVEFYTVYGDEPFHVTERENINDYINFLKLTDEVNICLGKDDYYTGTIDKIVYDIQYDESDQAIETIRVDVYDFRERLKDQEEQKKRSTEPVNKIVPNKAARIFT